MWANNAAVRASSPASREIDALIAALRKTPNNIDARMRLAQALAVAGRDDEAVEQYQQVLKLNKKFVPALSGLGFVLLKQKEWEKGETYFKRVIELTEDTAASATGTRGSSLETANYYTGIALLEQKKYEEAVAYLKEALRLRRDASDTSYALSVAYAKLDIKDGQRDMLEYTLQFDPKMPEANYDYGPAASGQRRCRGRRRALPDGGRRGPVQARTARPAREARHGECATRQGQGTREEGRRRPR